MLDTLEIKKIGYIDVYFRKQNMSVGSKPIELEKIIKYLTNEDFENYEGRKFQRRLINPHHFEIIDRYQEECDSDDEYDNYTCLCSEKNCSYLMIIKHKPTDTYMALGSVCYTRFDEENLTDIYYHCNAKKCDGCKVPLVFRASKFTKNTNKKCNGKCFDCDEKKRQDTVTTQLREGIEYADIISNENKRVYLNVSYADKDDAKSMGAWWDAGKKKWYAPNGSTKFTKLIKKYSSQ